MTRFSIKILLFISLPMFCIGQPFECNGDFILALSESLDPSIFYRLDMDTDNQTVSFDQLPSDNAGVRINAMGYRTTDNYIYGVHPEDYGLYRIDASGTATFVTDLALSDLHIYLSGDITPDGKYLVMLGNHKGWGGLNHIFVRVDLETYEVFENIIPNYTEFVRCTDIAFNPINGLLYGFEGQNQRLVEINAGNGLMDITTYPTTGVAKSVGALFFDPFGTLYGYGTVPGADLSDTFFKMDIETGEVTIAARGPESGGKDGCSCSNTVDLRKKVYPDTTFACTEVQYVFSIANASSFIMDDIDFLDEMPEGLTITEIIQNPFGGTILSGVGNNVLSINNMNLPQGIDSIVVMVEVGPGLSGELINQASLSNLPVSMGESTLSDDPRTIVVDDATVLQVISLDTQLENDTIGICSRDIVPLDATIYEGVTYEWDDGSTDPIRYVSEGGYYYISFSTDCETVHDSIIVIENTLDIELGPDHELVLGDSVLLSPTVNAIGPVTYEWTDPQANSLSCTECAITVAQPINDVTYELFAQDLFGCTDHDEISIRLIKERKIYIPNSFSPNFDGVNDYFYIQGASAVLVAKFRVYDRWGALMFEITNGVINDRNYGWDGRYKGEEMNNGVYTWYADLVYPDGEQSILSGGVTVIR